ncbi:MAG TPA: hypothetical protein VEC99_06615, partial [Clostridia bacterium]|nr:hypothetical protein [Clostridia bacterium]
QNSRCFRGLMDELNVYNKVLTLEEIQAVQKAPAGVPVAESPKLNVSRNQNQLAFSWTSSANFQLQYRDELGAGTWNDETTAPAVNGTQRTVTLPMTGSVRFYRLIGR